MFCDQDLNNDSRLADLKCYPFLARIRLLFDVIAYNCGDLGSEDELVRIESVFASRLTICLKQ